MTFAIFSIESQKIIAIKQIFPMIIGLGKSSHLISMVDTITDNRFIVRLYKETVSETNLITYVVVRLGSGTMIYGGYMGGISIVDNVLIQPRDGELTRTMHGLETGLAYSVPSKLTSSPKEMRHEEFTPHWIIWRPRSTHSN